MNKTEYRTLGGEIRAAAPEEGKKELRFEGYAAVFDSPTQLWNDWEEQIRKGAFEETIRNDDVRALFNHDPNYVLARNRAGTLALEEDAHGLHFELTAPDTAWARDLHASVERGDISQCSFGFLVQDEEWDRENHMRTLKKVQLFDVSIVTYPAYPETDAHARDMISAMNEKPEEPKKTVPVSVREKQLEALEKAVL